MSRIWHISLITLLVTLLWYISSNDISICLLQSCSDHYDPLSMSKVQTLSCQELQKKFLFLCWSDFAWRNCDWSLWLFQPLILPLNYINKSVLSREWDSRGVARGYILCEHVEGLPGCLCCLYCGGGKWPSRRRQGNSVH